MTREEVEARIHEEIYINTRDAWTSGPTGKTTVCVIRLKNGYECTGVSSVADHTKFDEQIGKDLARSDAFDKAWAVLAFLDQEINHNAEL